MPAPFVKSTQGVVYYTSYVEVRDNKQLRKLTLWFQAVA